MPESSVVSCLKQRQFAEDVAEWCCLWVKSLLRFHGAGHACTSICAGQNNLCQFVNESWITCCRWCGTSRQLISIDAWRFKVSDVSTFLPDVSTHTISSTFTNIPMSSLMVTCVLCCFSNWLCESLSSRSKSLSDASRRVVTYYRFPGNMNYVSCCWQVYKSRCCCWLKDIPWLQVLLFRTWDRPSLGGGRVRVILHGD